MNAQKKCPALGENQERGKTETESTVIVPSSTPKTQVLSDIGTYRNNKVRIEWALDRMAGNCSDLVGNKIVLGKDVFQSIPPERLSNFTIGRLRGIGEYDHGKHLQWVTRCQLEGLQAFQIEALAGDRLNNFTPEQIGFLAPDTLEKFPFSMFDGLTPEQEGPIRGYLHNRQVREEQKAIEEAERQEAKDIEEAHNQARIERYWAEQARERIENKYDIGELDDGELDKLIEDDDMLIDGWIPKGYVTIFYGDSKIGKSTAIRALCLSLARGEAVFPSMVPGECGGPGLILLGEDGRPKFNNGIKDQAKATPGGKIIVPPSVLHTSEQLMAKNDGKWERSVFLDDMVTLMERPGHVLHGH